MMRGEAMFYEVYGDDCENPAEWAGSYGTLDAAMVKANWMAHAGLTVSVWHGGERVFCFTNCEICIG